MENNVFEQMARRYDTEERIELAKVIVKEVRPQLRNSKSKSLIDYGSGTGLISLELSDLVDSILLVDSSKQMLEVAKAKISHTGKTNSKVLYSDFTQETPELKADIILMSLVLLHIPDTKKILQELFNILNNDGKLIIIDFDKNDKINHPKVHNGFSHEELKKILSEVGFKSIEIKTFFHGNRIFMNQDASMFISSSIKWFLVFYFLVHIISNIRTIHIKGLDLWHFEMSLIDFKSGNHILVIPEKGALLEQAAMGIFDWSITTFHVKTAKELSNKAPSLGIKWRRL